MGLGKLVVTLKSKVKWRMRKDSYEKIEKSNSMRAEIKSRKARMLTDQDTVRIIDSPRSSSKMYEF